MAKKVNDYIAELIKAYQEATGRTCSEMALDFDVTLSNLYNYRNGQGNPTAKTIDKIVGAVEANCSQLLEKGDLKDGIEHGGEPVEQSV